MRAKLLSILIVLTSSFIGGTNTIYASNVMSHAYAECNDNSTSEDTQIGEFHSSSSAVIQPSIHFTVNETPNSFGVLHDNFTIQKLTFYFQSRL